MKNSKQIGHRSAHYLRAIEELHNELGYARLTDVAKKMDITTGSCSLTIKTLKQKGLIIEDQNRFLLLSGEGKSFYKTMESLVSKLRTFFIDILKVDEEQAEEDICNIEHIISKETAEKLTKFIEDYQN